MVRLWDFGSEVIMMGELIIEKGQPAGGNQF